MGFTVVPDKASGDVFTEQMWDVYIRDNMNKGLIRPFADIVLGAASSPITFNTIPADWPALLLVIYARSNSATTTSDVTMRFNNDSSAIYDSQFYGATGTVGTSGEVIGGTFGYIGFMPANTAPANSFGPTVAFIPDYSSTLHHKTAQSLTGLRAGTSTGTQQLRSLGVHYRSTNAVTRIDLISNLGSFMAGTRATLYGIGGML
jgi:hypothetical protein